MIATLKIAVVTVAMFATVVAATTDTLAERVVLYTAAATGLAWLWRNMLRPAAKVLHRMASAVESLEDLPSWRGKTDRRIKLLEMGLGHVASGNEAILRELGIENKVRRQFSDPGELERLLADFAEDRADLEG